VGVLLAGVVLLTFFGLAVTVVLPAADPSLADVDATRTFDEQAMRGMEIYRSEGCWYCHTMQVRDVTSDTGLGEPLPAAAYAEQQPAMLGAERIGPDLSHVGARLDRDGVLQTLRRPRRDGRASSMPSYAHLSSAELDALASYLLSLR
jgi:cbb3-type cytochrome oxidase cytochrome c subunit